MNFNLIYSFNIIIFIYSTVITAQLFTIVNPLLNILKLRTLNRDIDDLYSEIIKYDSMRQLSDNDHVNTRYLSDVLCDNIIARELWIKEEFLYDIYVDCPTSQKESMDNLFHVIQTLEKFNINFTHSPLFDKSSKRDGILKILDIDILFVLSCSKYCTFPKGYKTLKTQVDHIIPIVIVINDKDCNQDYQILRSIVTSFGFNFWSQAMNTNTYFNILYRNIRNAYVNEFLIRKAFNLRVIESRSMLNVYSHDYGIDTIYPTITLHNGTELIPSPHLNLTQNDQALLYCIVRLLWK
ncbi:hypothetical protein 4 [Wuhan heteroptera virus 3]|uniref:hypothetical protein 4 n=1 Tax=Wuhan heteroptera virus 3 TaxID=1923703 RepID=UPI00090BD11D|nr:hypothetical protein 4 [Wuhan heteroptera virus 3]APG79072.1 hypothetical protein 4 [Wuhan heteroptera virus 3]APG79208.1 hypothetical protein 4 [Wuhan heteroptera virus 3]